MLGFSQLQEHVDGVVVETLGAREDEEIALGWLTDEGILVIIAKLEDPVLAGHFEATLILVSERNQRGQRAQCKVELTNFAFNGFALPPMYHGNESPQKSLIRQLLMTPT